MRQKILTAFVAALVLGSGTGRAESVDWTGFYAGADAGFALDRFAFSYGVALPGKFFSGDGTITSAGPVAGGNFAYEHLFGPGILAGIVLDGNWANITGSTTVIGGPDIKAEFATRESDCATARLKLGYTLDRWAPYLTGGLSLATARTSFDVSEPGFTVADGSTATRSGFFPQVGAAGLGLDYALAPRLRLTGEYIYDFTNARYAVYTPAPDTDVGFGTREMYHVFRLGVAWKLD
ncbi:MAG TPA: outer membrane beta-barrel protein [Rhizomicrobium sp.]|nr:outer membrane beta-barrel protein [Rhizomicrobium sp.]